MRFTSSLSTQRDASGALDEALAAAASGIAAADLVAIFASGYAPDDLDAWPERIAQTWPRATLIGCTAEGTIGDGHEIEGRPAVSLLAGELPDVRMQPFRLEGRRMVTPGDVARQLELDPDDDPAFIAVADPFTCDIKGFLDQVNDEFPRRRVVGGLASGHAAPGGNRMFLGQATHEAGLCGLALTGNVRIEHVVSQGCRPIGRHYVITRSSDNVIQQLGGRRAIEVLQEVAASLEPEDQSLLRRGLFVGRAINEYQSTFKRGDFLIQGVIGTDPAEGAIGIAGEARTGTTIQFHVRDSESADEDLRQLLAPHAGDGRHLGALLFSCNGRGTRMWDEPGHDVRVLQELCGAIPVSGFFCAGEIGPIGDENFIHGFTASIGLIAPRD